MKSKTGHWLLTIGVGVVATHLVYLLGRIAVEVLGLELIRLPDGTTPPESHFLFTFSGTLLLVAGMAPLVGGLSLSKFQRGVVLFLFLGWCYVLNTVMEAHLFSTLGGELSNLVKLSSIALVLSAVLAALAPVAKGATPLGAQIKSLFASRRAVSWSWRLLLAVLSFPLIYGFFGALIYPLIKDVYTQLDGYMHTPAVSIVFLGALSRGVPFLLVSFLIIATWKGSQRSLILSLGIALWVAVGASALLSTEFLPTRMRWVHGVEILADSMVHAWVLVKLLGKR